MSLPLRCSGGWDVNMRIGRVIGNMTCSPRSSDLPGGSLLIVDVLDDHALAHAAENLPRAAPMPESLVVYDELGAAVGQLIAISEGGEATQPFRPRAVPIDAYCAAILDTLDVS